MELQVELVDLIAAAYKRDPVHTAHSWLRAEGSQQRQDVLDGLLGDPRIAELAQPDAMIYTPAGVGTGYSPTHALDWFVDEAVRLPQTDWPATAKELLRFLRVDDGVISVRVRSSIAGPRLEGIDELILSLGTLTVAAPFDLQLDHEQQDVPGITLSYLVDVPARVGPAGAAVSAEVVPEIERRQVALLLALALAGVGPVHERWIGITPRFSSGGTSQRRSPASPLVVLGAYNLRPGPVMDDLQSWARRVAEMPVTRLGIPVRRLLAARCERTRPDDRIIDCGVALEALTGLTSGRRRGAMLRRLLARDDRDGRDVESAHTRVTDARNAILHEGEQIDDMQTAGIAEDLVRRALVEAISRGGALHDPVTEPAQRAQLDPLINPATLSQQVVIVRERYERQKTATRARWQAAIHTCLLHMEGVHEELCRYHAAIVEQTDLDPAAETRPAAAWNLMGRTLSLAKALLAGLRAGVGNAGIPVARSMHETARLLEAVLDEDGDQLLLRWLDDERLSPDEVRKTNQRAFARDREKYASLGLEVPESDPEQLSLDIYRVISASSHSQRSSVMRDSSAALRRYAYAIDDPEVMAGHVAGIAGMFEEAVLEVSAGLGAFYGPDFFSRQIKPRMDELHRLVGDLPRQSEG